MFTMRAAADGTYVWTIYQAGRVNRGGHVEEVSRAVGRIMGWPTDARSAEIEIEIRAAALRNLAARGIETSARYIAIDWTHLNREH